MRRLALCLGSGLLLVSFTVFAQSGFDNGASAYKRGDYEAALAVFRPLAENGDARAQSILGLMYSYGEGVPVDYRESARWYRRAAEQNSNVAQFNLGMLYLEGKGVPRNEDEAVKWLTLAADGGHFRARRELEKLGSGAYSSVASAPSESLETPPSMSATQPEPQSVVMRKQRPPAQQPEATTVAAAAPTASAAPAPKAKPAMTTTAATAAMPAKTNNNTHTNNHAGSKSPALQTSTGNDHVYRVQLAASRTEEYIRRDWSDYQSRYGDIFEGLEGSVERAEVGEDKTVWYRLRVGPFASMASAKELCLKLAERNIEIGCLPMRTTR